jgi:hypothetical protein
MIRQKIKGTKVRKSLSPEEEPNFYNMTGHLPTIPSEEEIAQHNRKKRGKKSASAAAAAAPEVTPMSTKPIKRIAASRRLSSNASDAYPISATEPQMTNDSYILLPHPSQPLTAATRTVSPHVSSVTLSDSHYKLLHMPLVPLPKAALTLPPQPAARGGDLLFFEGQPFRYLEHIEEIPPTPSRVVAMSRPPPMTAYSPSRSASLQDLMTTIRDCTEQPHVSPRRVFSV